MGCKSYHHLGSQSSSTSFNSVLQRLERTRCSFVLYEKPDIVRFYSFVALLLVIVKRFTISPSSFVSLLSLWNGVVLFRICISHSLPIGVFSFWREVTTRCSVESCGINTSR